MDSITDMIKSEIKKQYGSLARFCTASGIPYSTMTNALYKGVGGTAYDTVTRICEILHIRQAFTQELVIYNEEFHDIYQKLTELDRIGVHTVTAVLNAEYDRCAAERAGNEAGRGRSIAFVHQPAAFDEKKVAKLARQARSREKSK